MHIYTHRARYPGWRLPDVAVNMLEHYVGWHYLSIITVRFGSAGSVRFLMPSCYGNSKGAARILHDMASCGSARVT